MQKNRRMQEVLGIRAHALKLWLVLSCYYGKAPLQDCSRHAMVALESVRESDWGFDRLIWGNASTFPGRGLADADARGLSGLGLRAKCLCLVERERERQTAT